MLFRSQGKTQKLRDDTEIRAGNAKSKMKGLRSQHEEWAAKRLVQNGEIERRRIRIEQTEKKVGALSFFCFAWSG